MTNLKSLHAATESLSHADARSFENYFLGALSIFCPPDKWQKALRSAGQALAAEKAKGSAA